MCRNSGMLSNYFSIFRFSYSSGIQGVICWTIHILPQLRKQLCYFFCVYLTFSVILLHHLFSIISVVLPLTGKNEFPPQFIHQFFIPIHHKEPVIWPLIKPNASPQLYPQLERQSRPKGKGGKGHFFMTSAVYIMSVFITSLWEL